MISSLFQKLESIFKHQKQIIPIILFQAIIIDYEGMNRIFLKKLTIINDDVSSWLKNNSNSKGGPQITEPTIGSL